MAATYQHLSSVTAECSSGGPVCECCKEEIHSWVMEELSSSSFQQKQGEGLPAAGWLHHGRNPLSRGALWKEFLFPGTVTFLQMLGVCDSQSIAKESNVPTFSFLFFHLLIISKHRFSWQRGSSLTYLLSLWKASALLVIIWESVSFITLAPTICARIYTEILPYTPIHTHSLYDLPLLTLSTPFISLSIHTKESRYESKINWNVYECVVFCV